MIPIDQIKALTKSGDFAGAEALCKKALEAHPDDVWLKRRYGMCRRLQGDEETFRRINDELSPEMLKKKESLRDMYYKLWFALIVVALAIGGAVAFKYVMIGVLVVAAILEMIECLLLKDESSSLFYYTRNGALFPRHGALIGAVMAGMVVYFGHWVRNSGHTCDPAHDVVLEVEPAGTNILDTVTTNGIVPTVETIEQLLQPKSETP